MPYDVAGTEELRNARVEAKILAALEEGGRQQGIDYFI